MQEPPGPGRTKKRTRSHVLEAISRNHVERFIVRRGHSFEHVRHDYGTDLLLLTYDDRGMIENGHVALQLKATDAPRVLKDGKTLAIEVDAAHLSQWLWEVFPVILILYDARGRGRAYWLYVQRSIDGNFLEEKAGVSAEVQDSVTLRIPMSNRFDGRTVERFRRFRDDILNQAREAIRHDA